MAWISVPGAWMRAHLSEIAFSITAMLLVVGGPYLNAGLKGLTRTFHWLARYALFVLLSTVGYGLITNYGLRTLRGALRGLTNVQLFITVLAAHLILAWLLKRDKAI